VTTMAVAGRWVAGVSSSGLCCLTADLVFGGGVGGGGDCAREREPPTAWAKMFGGGGRDGVKARDV
jgi:hypothetical protein